MKPALGASKNVALPASSRRHPQEVGGQVETVPGR